MEIHQFGKKTEQVVVTKLASHLDGFPEIIHSLNLDKIKLPCIAFTTGKISPFGDPILRFPSGRTYSARWFEINN